MTILRYEMEDQIAVVTLDDGKMNVMNREFFEELDVLLDRALEDGSRALIFTGRPGVFSAGLDLKLLPTQSLMEQMRFQKQFAEVMLRVYLLPIPTIAAYAGHAIAGGAILSYACDRFMVGDGPFKIQINEVANKMAIPSWILLICRSSVPSGGGRSRSSTRGPTRPARAFERGIADDLLEEGADVLAAARVCAREFFRLDARAYAATKKNMRQEGADHVMEVFEKEMFGWRMSVLPAESVSTR